MNNKSKCKNKKRSKDSNNMGNLSFSVEVKFDTGDNMETLCKKENACFGRVSGLVKMFTKPTFFHESELAKTILKSFEEVDPQLVLYNLSIWIAKSSITEHGRPIDLEPPVNKKTPILQVISDNLDRNNHLRSEVT